MAACRRADIRCFDKHQDIRQNRLDTKLVNDDDKTFFPSQQMNKSLAITLGILLLNFNVRADFLAEQRRFERVRTAITEKQELVERKLRENQISVNNVNLLLVAYKDDDRLDVYAKRKQDKIYKKVLSYDICSRSGLLGPKWREGDRQVPEGFYYIDRFNPTSNFFLSLGLNYPNVADKRRSKTVNLGGDIFIHGQCVTIGCLPLTDDFIKEVYLLAVHARNNGQSKIPVYVFPFQMADQRMSVNKKKYNKELTDFWDNLKVGHDNFMRNKQELTFKISKTGSYSY